MRVSLNSLASLVGSISALGICLLLTAFPGQIKAQDYQMDGLGTFGGQASFGMAINDGGAVAGYFEIQKAVGLHWHGFVYADGEEWDCGAINGTNSWMDDINNEGQAVGYSDIGPAEFHAAIWERGVIRDLGTLGGIFSRARAINDVGVAVGLSSTTFGDTRGCVWWPDGSKTELQTFGGYESQAFDVNERNQVVGFARDINNTGKAFIWANGAMFELPSLAGKFTKAEAINNFGIIVGWSQLSSGEFRAVSWDSSFPVELPSLGGDNSWAYDVNDNGIIVGGSENALGAMRATVWSPSGAIDLNDLLSTKDQDWELRKAWGINDAGTIIGTGQFKGMPQAWMMTPDGFIMHAPVSWLPGGVVEAHAKGAQAGALIEFKDEHQRVFGTATADAFGNANWSAVIPATHTYGAFKIHASEAASGRTTPQVVFRKPK